MEIKFVIPTLKFDPSEQKAFSQIKELSHAPIFMYHWTNAIAKQQLANAKNSKPELAALKQALPNGQNLSFSCFVNKETQKNLSGQIQASLEGNSYMKEKMDGSNPLYIGIAVSENPVEFYIFLSEIPIPNQSQLDQIIQKNSVPYTPPALFSFLQSINSKKSISQNNSISETFSNLVGLISAGKMTDLQQELEKFFQGTGDYIICSVASTRIDDIAKSLFDHPEFFAFLNSPIVAVNSAIGTTQAGKVYLILGGTYTAGNGDYEKLSPEQKEEISNRILECINPSRKNQGLPPLESKFSHNLYIKFKRFVKTLNQETLKNFAARNGNPQVCIFVEKPTIEESLKEATSQLMKNSNIFSEIDNLNITSRLYSQRNIVQISIVLLKDKDKGDNSGKDKNRQEKQQPKREDKPRKEEKPRREDKPKRDDKPKREDKPRKEEKPFKKDKQDGKPKKDFKPKNPRNQIPENQPPVPGLVIEEINNIRNENSCKELTPSNGPLQQKAEELAKYCSETHMVTIKEEKRATEGFSSVNVFVVNVPPRKSNKEWSTLALNDITYGDNMNILLDDYDEVAVAMHSLTIIVLLGKRQ